MEAKAYATINNYISDPNRLDYVYSQLQTVGSYGDDTQAQNKLNELLDNTTVKRACCKNHKLGDPPKTVVESVRLPIPTGSVPSTTSATGKLQEQFKYMDMDVNVDISDQICGKFTKETDKCDDFYATYCGNILGEYLDINGIPKLRAEDYDKYPVYKKECGCYLPIPPEWGVDPDPVCMLQSCKSPGAYKDPRSRKSQCNMVLCAVNLTVNGEKINSLDLSDSVSQNCQGKTETNTSTKVDENTTNNTTNNTSTDTTTNNIADYLSNAFNPANKSDSIDDTGNASNYIAITVAILVACCCFLIIAGIILFFIFGGK